MKKIAIIGFGCAGFNAVRAIRDSNCGDDIHVYSVDDLPPFNPMLTTYYVSGKIGFNAMFPFGTLEEITEKYKITVHTGKKVNSIDEKRKSLTLDDGLIEGYDKLLIATGASAFVPKLGTSDDARVYCMRTVQDAMRLKKTVENEKIKSAAVIGASMVGIKVMELLYNRGIACTLADMADHIFPLAAFPDVSKIIEDRLTKKNISLKFGCGLSGANSSPNGIISSYSDGSEIESDILVICIGTRANTALTRGTSIETARGIIVDEHMETSVKDIYAAGDCAQGKCLQSGESQIIGLWANAAYQGETAGLNIAGTDARFAGNILHNITHFMDMDFISLGDSRSVGEKKAWFEPKTGRFIEAVIHDNQVCCINILDNYKISGIVKNYMLESFCGKLCNASPVMKGLLLRQGVPEELIGLMEGGKDD